MTDQRRRRATPAAVLFVALLLTLFAAACGDGPSDPPVADPDTPRTGGTIVIGSISDVDSWNEYRSQQSFAVNLLRRIYLRLAREPRPGSGPDDYTPLLAESWAHGADGRSLTFTLRDAQWSDGKPVRAADVRFTWQAQTSADVAWVGAESKQHITDVEVIDERSVRFHYDMSYPYQLADAVDGGILPQHVFGQVPFSDWTTHDWSEASIASGPFLLESHRAGLETVLRRNPRYFEPDLPFADRLVVRYVPDVGNLLTQLLAGDIDYLEGVPPRDAARLAGNPQISLIPFDYPAYDYLGWNGRRAPFADPAIRRAMTLAIDREALVEDLLYGYGRVSRGPLPASWWGSAQDIAPLPYDPDEARRILRSRGYAVSSGPGEPPGDGEPLELELLTNSGNSLREDMLVKIQEQLSRIGVRVRPLPLEMRSMRQKIVAGDFDAYLGGWVFAGRVDLATFFRTAAPYNVVGYESSPVDQLFDRLDSASRWEEVAPLLHEAQQVIHQDQPYTFLYETKRIAAHGPRIAGVEIEFPSDPLAGLERCWLK